MTKSLVRLVLSNYKDGIDNHVLGLAKIALLDFFGVSLLGSNEVSVQTLLKYHVHMSNVQDEGGHFIFGSHKKLRQLDAVEVNGCSAHSLDLDDTGASTQSHPSALLFPALLSITEKKVISGEDLLKSYVIGVEVLNLLSKKLQFLHSKGWHPSSVFGPIACAVSCSLLLGLNEKELINSIGIAASNSGGLISNFGSHTKHLHIGSASASGLKAAFLSKEGFTASDFILENQKGFFYAFGAGEGEKMNESFIAGFGKPWAIEKPGLNFKQYPCCALSHRLIDIASDLRSTYKFTIDEIESIKCRATPRAKQILFYQFPKEGLQGKFSVYYLISRALKDGKVGADDFTEEKIKDLKIKELMKLVSFEVHEDWHEEGDDWRPDRLEIRLTDGSVYVGNSVYPKGHANNPFDWDLIQKKFQNCTVGILDSNRKAQLIESIGSLENLEDSSHLLKIIKLL